MIGEKLTWEQRMAGITHALGNLVAKFPGPEEQPVPLLTICARRAEIVRASWSARKGSNRAWTYWRCQTLGMETDAMIAYSAVVRISDTGTVSIERLSKTPPAPQDTVRIEHFLEEGDKKELVSIVGAEVSDLLNEAGIELEAVKPQLAFWLFRTAKILREGRCARCQQ